MRLAPFIIASPVIAASLLFAGVSSAECRRVCKAGEVANLKGCCVPAPRMIILPTPPGATPPPPLPKSSVSHAEFSTDGMRIVSAEGKFARVRDVGTGKLLHEMENTGGLRSASFSADGKQILMVPYMGMPSTWDARTGRKLVSLDAVDVTDARFAPDGKTIAVAKNHARILDAATGKTVHGLAPDDLAANVQRVRFSPDGTRVATAGTDARIWDAATGKQLHVLPHAKSEVSTVEYSPGGDRVVTGGKDKAARVWDTATGKLLLTLNHAAPVSHAIFSSDGMRIASVSKNTVHVWNAESGKMEHALAHPTPVRDVHFSPDGAYVLTAGGEDKTARIWNARTGKESYINRQDFWVSGAKFSSDGKWIVTAGGESKPNFWEFIPRR